MRNMIIESVDYVLMMIFTLTKDILNLKDSFRNKLALLYVNHFSRTWVRVICAIHKQTLKQIVSSYKKFS